MALLVIALSAMEAAKVAMAVCPAVQRPRVRRIFFFRDLNECMMGY